MQIAAEEQMLDKPTQVTDTPASVRAIIEKTYHAAGALRKAGNARIVKALEDLATLLQANSQSVLEANRKDVERQDADDPKTDRLRLTEQRIAGIANGIRKVSRLPNPAGKSLEKRTLDNGLLLEKIAVPLGVVGAIYESRPNVTFDIAALCLRSMNGCILKGSKDAEHSNLAAIELIGKALAQNGIDPDCVTLLPAARETVQELFVATKYVDVIIPRGSDGLIQYVRKKQPGAGDRNRCRCMPYLCGKKR